MKIQNKKSTTRNTNDATLRTCSNGHRYYKSSDCPVCPVCDAAQKPSDGFLSLLSAPARRALIQANITSPQQLSAYSIAGILKLHGIGKSAIPILQSVLEKNGLAFKE